MVSCRPAWKQLTVFGPSFGTKHKETPYHGLGRTEWAKNEETALSCDLWCCNVLVRNSPSVTGDLFCKGTKNWVRLSHWEIYLLRRQRSSTGPWAAGERGLDGFTSRLSPSSRWREQLPCSPHLCNNNQGSAHLWPSITVWRNSSGASCPTFKAILCLESPGIWLSEHWWGTAPKARWGRWDGQRERQSSFWVSSQLLQHCQDCSSCCPGYSCSPWAQIFPLFILGRTGTFHSVFQNLSIILYGPP